MPPKVTLKRHFSSSTLMKVMNTFQSHPIATIFFSPVSDQNNEKSQESSKHGSKKYLNMSTIQQKLYDCQYQTFDSWYNDCMSVFDNSSLFFSNDNTNQTDITDYCKRLFHKIALDNGVNKFSEWSDTLYRVRERLNSLMQSVPQKVQIKKGTRKKHNKNAAKLRKIMQIKQVLTSFKTPQEMQPTLMILYNEGYIDGKEYVDLDFSTLSQDTINLIYRDLKDRSLLVSDDEFEKGE